MLLGLGDDVVGENAVGATVHRHSDDVEATAVGERPQDRSEYVACPAALRVEIEDAIALREIAKRHFLLRFAVINPCALRQRRHRALQRLIAIGRSYGRAKGGSDVWIQVVAG